MLSTQRSARHLMVACCLFLAGLAGCNNGPHSSVQGRALFDGEKINGGAIVFIPLKDNDLARITGKIIDGHYSLDSQHGPDPGKHRVEIYWQKKSGNKVPGEGGIPRDEIVSGIPPKYNTESELTVDVQPGSNTFHFDLKK